MIILKYFQQLANLRVAGQQRTPCDPVKDQRVRQQTTVRLDRHTSLHISHRRSRHPPMLHTGVSEVCSTD